MANIYDVIKDVDASLDNKHIDKSPAWCLTVISMKKPITYDRRAGKSVEGSPGSAAEFNKKLIITSDCTQITINKGKANYLKTLNANLKQTDINYLNEIFPGDWIFAHIVKNEEELNNLIANIRDNKPVNKFEDGLKFVGRVNSIKKRVSVARGLRPNKTTNITINAIAFKELATFLFYDYSLSEHDIEYNNIGTWLAKLGYRIQDLFGNINKDNRQDDNVHLIIPSLVDLIIGKGINIKTLSPATEQSQGQLQSAFGAGDSKTAEAPYAYTIPKEVGILLGMSQNSTEEGGPSKKPGVTSFADIFEMLYGVQKYEGKPTNKPETFIPTLDSSTGRRRYTGKPMLGSMVPFMPAFVNKPLWNVLQNYLNPVLNEMYTCFRVNPDGNIMPTMVLRQIPFSTDVFNSVVEGNKDKQTIHRFTLEQAYGDIETEKDVSNSLPTDLTNDPYKNITLTRFLELPRWRIHPTMVHDIELGRSDATRCNFIHVYGQDSALSKQNTITEQIALNPPVRDDLDIQRSGLHSFMQTINVGISSTIGKTPSAWMHVIADFLMGHHLTVSGNISCTGIYAPICEGDNIEFEGIVFHIESLTERCGMRGSAKYFETDLVLSNGVQARDKQDSTEQIFIGLSKDDSDPSAKDNSLTPRTTKNTKIDEEN